MATQSTWDRIDEVFGKAMELSGEVREAYLKDACQGDDELLARASALLRAHDTLEDAGAARTRIPDTLDPGLAGLLLQEVSIDYAEGSLVGRYRIVRRAASGGMGVVYHAHDPLLDRAVALKVLPLWRTADADANRRLEDEARAASALDHPNIATVYEIGEGDDGRRFIAMAWYEGDNLRHRLRSGPLSISEAVSIGRQVAEGLAAAHRRGVIHRDIKPENIAFGRGDRAVILDFGIASAVRLSTKQGSKPPGTAAYMSPEHASGETADERSDIWSLGVVLYEMIAGGRPPDLEQVPETHGDIPAKIAHILNRCLDPTPSSRISDASELAAMLRSVETGLAEGPGPDGVARLFKTVHARSLWQTATVYGVGTWVCYQLLARLPEAIGLPAWVPSSALVLLLVGLPIVLVTAFVQRGGPRRRALRAPAATGVWPLEIFTWRRSFFGGVMAFSLLAAGAIGFTGMRALGIGPLGTLEARGMIDQREPILLADFATAAADPHLGRVLTEALRIDLLQSASLKLAEPLEVADALRRMGLDPAEGLPLSVARELAEREGLKAVITGEIAMLGGGYVLTAQVVGARNGEILTATRETARDSTGLIDAVDRLSKRLRERIGEPLRALHRAEPLPRVATASLPALRKYAEGAALSGRGGDDAEIAGLMEQAVAIDSMFAAAYRGLAVAYWNLRVDQGKIIHATRRAYELRDRLPERERLLAEATYYTNIVADMSRAGEVFARVLELDPSNPSAINNLGLAHLFLGRPVEAEAVLRRAPQDGPAMIRQNLADALLFQDRVDAALAELDLGAAEFGESPLWAVTRIRILGADCRWDETEAACRAALRDHADNTQVRMLVLRSQWHLALLRGRMADAERRYAELLPVLAELGASEMLARVRLQRAESWLTLLGDSDRARLDVLEIQREIDLLTAGAVIAPRAAATLAGSGATREAASLLRSWEALPPEMRAHVSYYSEEKGWARIDMAAGRYAEAIERLERAAADPVNYINVMYDLGRAYRLAGRPHEAISTFERYLETKHSRWLHRVPPYLGPTLIELGQLYEETLQPIKAVGAHQRLIAIWDNADAVLQPHVREARRRLQHLEGR